MSWATSGVCLGSLGLWWRGHWLGLRGKRRRSLDGKFTLDRDEAGACGTTWRDVRPAVGCEVWSSGEGLGLTVSGDLSSLPQLQPSIKGTERLLGSSQRLHPAHVSPVPKEPKLLETWKALEQEKQSKYPSDDHVWKGLQRPGRQDGAWRETRAGGHAHALLRGADPERGTGMSRSAHPTGSSKSRMWCGQGQ